MTEIRQFRVNPEFFDLYDEQFTYHGEGSLLLKADQDLKRFSAWLTTLQRPEYTPLIPLLGKYDILLVKG